MIRVCLRWTYKSTPRVQLSSNSLSWHGQSEWTAGDKIDFLPFWNRICEYFLKTPANGVKSDAAIISFSQCSIWERSVEKLKFFQFAPFFGRKIIIKNEMSSNNWLIVKCVSSVKSVTRNWNVQIDHVYRLYLYFYTTFRFDILMYD